MNEKEKEFDKKVKLFDKWLFEILVNIGVSMVTAIVINVLMH